MRYVCQPSLHKPERNGSYKHKVGGLNPSSPTREREVGRVKPSDLLCCEYIPSTGKRVRTHKGNKDMNIELNLIDEQKRRIEEAATAEEKAAVIVEAMGGPQELSDEEMRSMSGGAASGYRRPSRRWTTR